MSVKICHFLATQFTVIAIALNAIPNSSAGQSEEMNYPPLQSNTVQGDSAGDASGCPISMRTAVGHKSGATPRGQISSGAWPSDELMKEVNQVMGSAREKGNPLLALDFLRPLWKGEIPKANDAQRGPDPQQLVAAMLMNLSAEIGNYADALKFADLLYEEPSVGKSPNVSLLEGYRAVDALKAIGSLAETHQIILINEAHHAPQHRAFTFLLLQALRQKGFTHFAAETLSERDAQMNERRYPTKATGFYTNEPLYGELVRTAFKLGYRVVPYEWAGEYTPDKRERGQAQNLVDRILKDNPKAKILVHAGHGHIDESGGGISGARTMAQRLKEITGIDPLTIDQTEMTEHSAPDYERPLYRYIMAKKLISNPSVFQNAQSEWWTAQKGKRDLTLFHPRSEYQDGRPTWLRLGGERKPYKLPKDVCQTAPRCLVRARAVTEEADAVPVDQVEVIADNKLLVLMLPPGEFAVEVKDAADKILKTWRIKLR
jgi:hypothetical protein